VNWIALVLRRHVFAVMILAFFTVIGIVSYSRLVLNMMPQVEIPIVTVLTIYPGASPDVIAEQVTNKLEDTVSVIEGIEDLSSYSTEGASVLIVSFEEGRDIDIAAQDVRDKVALAKPELPEDAEDPTITKADINAMPVVAYSITSTSMAPRELREFVDKRIKDSLEQVTGVAQVQLTGGLEREIRVVVDPAKLEAHRLTPDAVGRAIAAANVDFPAGTLKQGPLEFVLKVPAQFQSVEEIAGAVIFSERGERLKVGDVATVVDSTKEREMESRYNGKSAIAVTVIKRSDASSVSVSHAVKQRMRELEDIFPHGVDSTVAYDLSEWVVHSLDDVKLAILLGAILASFVVWLFVGRLSFAIPITLSILVSLIAAFSPMHFFGFSLNFISLMALAVAIGLVIDDAIVVQESIIRVHEETGDAYEAATRGTSEVGLAVLACTSTLIAVFMPVAFMKGMIGQIFKEFGLTVAFAVIFSLLVSLTLIPLMSTQTLRLGVAAGARSFLTRLGAPLMALHYGFARFYEWLQDFYARILDAALRRPATVIFWATIFFLLAFPILTIMQKGFMPSYDTGVFQITMELPVESSLKRTDAKVREVEELLTGLPEVKGYLSMVGQSVGGVTTMSSTGQTNLATIAVVMPPKKERKLHLRWWGIIPVPYKYTQSDLIEMMRERVKPIAGAKITVSAMAEMGQRAAPVQLSFTDPDYEKLKSVTAHAQKLLAEIPGTINVDNSERAGKLEISIRPHRDRLAELGMNPAMLGQTLRILYHGATFSTYREGGEEYDITLMFPQSSRYDLSSLRSLKLWSPPLEEPISLETVADLKLAQAPAAIQHYNKIRSIDVYADILPGVGGGSVLNEWKRRMKQENVLPPTTTIAALGEARMYGRMMRQFMLALILGIIFTYMVLASQFNSYKHPFTIMMSLPLAVTGALFVLLISGKGFDIMGFLGLILLMGLVTKNAILLVDFANQARARGLDVIDALKDAGSKRLRPILMTSFATIAALLPTAISMQEGSDFRSPLAVAVIGGMFFSTLLTLIVIPVVYMLVERLGGGRKLASEGGGSTAVE